MHWLFMMTIFVSPLMVAKDGQHILVEVSQSPQILQKQSQSRGGTISVSRQPAQSITACVANRVVLGFEASSSDGTLTYQWRKDGKDIVGARSATLVINSAAANDEGSYDCLLANDSESLATDSSQLTVSQLIATTIPERIMSQGIDSQIQATLICRNSESPVYTWTNVNSGEVLGSSASLTINPPFAESTEVELRVVAGEDSATASILVLAAPASQINDPDGDGSNTIADLHRVLPDWGTQSKTFDANNDGQVNILDLLYINVGL